MAPSLARVGCVLALTVTATMVSAAPDSSATTTAAATSDTASSASPATTSSDVPLSLWSDANSLLTSYYPSTTLTGVASLTWPSTVLVGGSTYHVLSGTTQTPSKSLANASPSTTSDTSSAKDLQEIKNDKRLGIILGVSIGVVAFAIMAVLFCCLSRRKRKTGSYFRRRTPSISSSEVHSWRGSSLSPFGNSAYAYAGAPNPAHDKYGRMAAVPQRKPPPMTMHPAYARTQDDRSSDENPFYTPMERADAQIGEHDIGAQRMGPSHFSNTESQDYAAHPAELDHHEPSQRRSSSSVRNSRPPTPFSPFIMTSGNHQHQPRVHNPFASPEDDESGDVISPIVPSKHPDRRYSPLVHYPSWSEVSDFDFSGDGRGRSLRGQSSSEDGGDGWRAERVSGRHELA